jgi:hypothetical protein
MVYRRQSRGGTWGEGGSLLEKNLLRVHVDNNGLLVNC